MLLTNLEPFSDVMSDGTGGGSWSGGEVGAGDWVPAQTDAGGGTPPQATPQAVEITNDSYLRLPGVKDPVKYSDYVKGFVPKPDFTRKQQESAAEIKRLQSEVSRRDDALRRWEQSRTSAQAQTNPLEPLLNELRGRTYIDGQTAAQMMEGMYGGMVQLAGALQQRDRAIQLLMNRIDQVAGTATELKGARGAEQYQGLKSQVIANLKLPNDPYVNDLIDDVYFSHEGWDEEENASSILENMVKARWDASQKLVRASDQNRVQESRRRLLKPGLDRAGGNATPSNPLKDKKLATATPGEMADALWPMISGGGNT